MTIATTAIRNQPGFGDIALARTAAAADNRAPATRQQRRAASPSALPIPFRSRTTGTPRSASRWSGVSIADLHKGLAVDHHRPRDRRLQAPKIRQTVGIGGLAPIGESSDGLFRPGRHDARTDQSACPVRHGLRQPRVVHRQKAGTAAQLRTCGGDFGLDRPKGAHATATAPTGCTVKTARELRCDFAGLGKADIERAKAHFS